MTQGADERPERGAAGGAARGPFVLFLPGGGSNGVGEYARSLILAQAVVERWPGARVEFVASEDNPRLPHDPFPRHSVSGKLSRSVDEVEELLRELRPDVAFFDNTGRAVQLIQARRLGIRTVFVTSLPQTRRRIFRLRRLRHIDQLWIVQLGFESGPPRPSPRERLLLALAGGTPVHCLDSIFPASDPERRAKLRHRLGIAGEPYLLFVPGGGGWAAGGRPVAEIFLAAASRVREATGAACVVVMGPLYAGETKGRPGVSAVASLPPEEMIDLIHDAELLACGGGGILCQAAAHRRPCVVAPTGPVDQEMRARAFAARGLIVPSRLDADAIAQDVIALHVEPERRLALEERLERAGMGSGLEGALRNLERLFESETGAGGG